MISTFIEHLEQYLALSVEDKAVLYQTLSTKFFKKGSYILEEGQVSKAFFFNLKGLVRLFYNKGEAEVSAYFYPEGYFISAYESFVKQIPTNMNLQALESTELIQINFSTAAELLAYSPKFETIARIAMEDELITYQKLIATTLTLSPQERYEALLNDHPNLIQRIPQRYLASYIGVKPESLSRIKKRFMEKTLTKVKKSKSYRE